MDTTAQQTIPPVPQGTTQVPVQPVVQPISTPLGKEVVSIPAKEPVWVQETAPEAEVDEEVEAAGVEKTPTEKLHIAPDVAQAGVTPVGPVVPIPEEPNIQFPMTEEKAKKLLLHKKIWNSATWLAMLVVRQMQQLQFMQNKKNLTKPAVEEVTK